MEIISGLQNGIQSEELVGVTLFLTFSNFSGAILSVLLVGREKRIKEARYKKSSQLAKKTLLLSRIYSTTMLYTENSIFTSIRHRSPFVSSWYQFPPLCNVRSLNLEQPYSAKPELAFSQIPVKQPLQLHVTITITRLSCLPLRIRRTCGYWQNQGLSTLLIIIISIR